MSWDIRGKRVLVTGANSGIGLATAIELARRRADVTIAVRDTAKGAWAAHEISRTTGCDVSVRQLDLSRPDSIRSLAAQLASEHERLDVLINNAGLMTGRRRETVDGHEWTFAVNHLGPFLLTVLLTPMLTSGAPSRIITVSSAAHRGARRGLDFDDLQMRNGYSSSKAYAASKLANILFTVELDRRLGDAGVTARALHPGAVGTSFGQGPEGPRWMRLLMKLGGRLLLTPERGATTPVMLATADDPAIAGGLYWARQRPKRPHPIALDPDHARRLWDASERLVGQR